jgi:eukaryotic-like serine/threonine-protein kinase
MNRSSYDALPADSSGPFDATLDARESAAQPVSMRSTTRTTVLPRVEWKGDAATLVSTSRPRFQAQGGLGEGGVGEVVAALDQDIGREVAIKRLRSDVQGPAALARFVDEIRTVGALEHPNIVPIHDVGVDEAGGLYFVMRRVQGQTLESIIEKLAAGDPLAHAHWTFERRVHLFRQLLDAVAFAHDRGFVHRDIKPANVMVGHFGEVFLMDWGIAKPLSAEDHALPRIDALPQPSRVTETHAGAIIGTPVYMSPEQARGEKADVRSDIYSLCVLFHELLGLEHYLAGATTMEAVLHGVQHHPAPLVGFVSNPHQSTVPMDLGWFLRKGLEKDPSRRYATVAAMIDRLDARDEGKIPIQCHVTFTKRVSREMLRWMDRHPLLFTLSLVAVLVGSAGLGVMRLLGR